MLEIKSLTFNEFISDPMCSDLLDEHVQESANKEMPPISVNAEFYKKLESVGALRALGAYDDGEFIGLICMLISPNLHYSRNICTIESFFVRPEYRKSGAGLKLLSEAEKLAKEADAVAIFVSAQVESNLEKAMSASKRYKATNTIFFRSLL